MDKNELKRFGDLRLRLRVNGEIRQDILVERDIIYPPVQALEALSRFQRLDALMWTPNSSQSTAMPARVPRTNVGGH
jgi:Fumarylacetoacetate (FAA) hydrolase family